MDKLDYSTEFEGGRPVVMRYAIAGRMDVPAFLAFVAERASWLDIAGWVAPAPGGVTLVAAGPEALVGALEMACTLGPLDALVERIEGTELSLTLSGGFEIRRPDQLAQK